MVLSSFPFAKDPLVQNPAPHLYDVAQFEIVLLDHWKKMIPLRGRREIRDQEMFVQIHVHLVEQFCSHRVWPDISPQTRDLPKKSQWHVSNYCETKH